MWLVILAFAAVMTTFFWYTKDTKGEYKLGFLSLVFWGATIMVFVDHLIAYFEEGEFFDRSLDAILLGIVLVIVALIVWEIFLIVKDPRGRLKSVLRR